MNGQFPAPWRPEQIPGGYAIRDAAGKVVAHIYGRPEPWKANGVPAPLTMDEAREMAIRIAKLPEAMKDDVNTAPPQREAVT